jgi:hypothetical protein
VLVTEGTEVTLVQSNMPLEVEEEHLLKGWTEYFWNRLKKYFSLKEELMNENLNVLYK